MVMGKVSKAIAASFLCLSLFNASGDFASAMNNMMIDSKENSFKENTEQVIQSEDDNVIYDKKTFDEVSSKILDEYGKYKDEDKDKTPDDKKKGLPEWAIRTLIGVGSGVGGMILGILLGKFAF